MMVNTWAGVAVSNLAYWLTLVSTWEEYQELLNAHLSFEIGQSKQKL